jgi:hypothetical protein
MRRCLACGAEPLVTDLWCRTCADRFDCAVQLAAIVSSWGAGVAFVCLAAPAWVVWRCLSWCAR